jgi:hypothetical protein
MAARQNRRKDAVYGLLLADDALANLSAEPANGAYQALKLLNVVGRSGVGGGGHVVPVEVCDIGLRLPVLNAVCQH